MDSLITTFHIDIKLLLAQVVNFAIVASVLWFFALRPLVKILQDRSATIEKSLQNAKDIEAKVTATTSEYQATVRQAREEAAVIVREARAAADEQRTSALAKTKAEVERIVVRGKEQLATEKVKMIAEAQSQVGQLVAAATAQVLAGVVTKEVDKKVIDRALKDVQS